MHTVLDDAKTWFLHGIAYQDDLLIILTEGFVSDQTEDIQVGEQMIKDTHPTEVRESSRMIAVRFARFVAWQVVDESFTAFDKYEERDDTGRLQTLSRSKYLDYVNGNHGWYEDISVPPSITAFGLRMKSLM